jgi:hypothetical protein
VLVLVLHVSQAIVLAVQQTQTVEQPRAVQLVRTAVLVELEVMEAQRKAVL